MIKRELQKKIEERLFKGKAIILIGARQVGKSTLMQQITSEISMDKLMLNCDNPETNTLLTTPSETELRQIIGKNKVVIIDEAQQVPVIGLTLKRIIDQYPDVQLLVTGSSSLDLQDKLSEPLTGRKYIMHLYPFSTKELIEGKGLINVKGSLKHRLIYGSYPYIVEHPSSAEDDLMELSNSYLYKDLLKLEDIRRPVLLDKLLKALAFQIGNLISYNELAQLVGTDSKTVEKYIDLLEKCYVVFRLNGLSRNPRNELKKAKKIYFYDNGIRNAVIHNFAPIDLRQDTGALWENFIIAERIKYNEYNNKNCISYFWRSKSQQEIDYVEEYNGVISPVEFKISQDKATKVKIPKTFHESYAPTTFDVVTPENYLDWLGVS